MRTNNFFQTAHKPSDQTFSTSNISVSILKGNAINHYRDKCSLKEPILSEQDDSENYYSEIDNNLEKEKEHFEKVFTTLY